MTMASTSTNTTSNAMNYALVSGAVVDVGAASTTKQQSSNKRDADLTFVFEQYAQQHSNPKLANEHEERDALLQQVAASQKEMLNDESIPPKQKKKSGLFGFLWSKKARHDHAGDGLYDTSHLNEHEWLEYYTDDETETAAQDCTLCDSMLDTSCIPQEAFSMARFHLSCRRNVPNVATCRSREGGTPITITLVDVGVICEIQSTGESIVMETSDRQALQEYISATSTMYDVSQARSVHMVESNVLAVSWGLSDGIVVLYQRHEHSWDSFAIISPTRAVSDNIQQANVNGMLVTDLVTMTVQDPNDVGAVVTTLAISRLGGYIEFIIVPRLASQKHHRKQKRKRGSDHYAANLPNISYSDTGMTALTTADYHTDVLCLEIYRTKVGSDTEWDTSVFPKTPPAEYVLAASGGTTDGNQVISFWGVSMVFPENVAEESASIHVAFLDGIILGSAGADVTVFASEQMWENWRTPRRVRLRAREQSEEQKRMTEGEMEVTDDTPTSALVDANLESKRLPLSTLSTPMPIVRIRLTSRDSQPDVILAALDGNGGVSFIDCTTVVALAAHDVTEDELGDDSLLKMRCRLPPESTSATVDIGWLDAETPSKVDDETFYEDGYSPSFSLVTVKPRMLQVVSLPSNEDARVSYSLNLSFLSHGATFVGSSERQCISFVAFDATETRRKLLCQGNLERLDSSTVIAMLVKASKYAEAIAAAETMNVPSSSDTIQLCHRKLWERDGNVRHLSAVIDNDSVVNEVLTVFDDSDSKSDIDLAEARAACLLALERVGNEAEEIKLRLEALEAKVSTYILLCMRTEAVPQLAPFREKFLPTSLRQLASAFATKGDIVALTTILFRHRPDLLPCQLEILDKLPLETPPDSFAHLLPVSRPGKSCFHTGEHGVGGLRQWLFMTNYMESTYGVRLLLDDKDETAIRDRSRLFDDMDSVLQAASIQDWYLIRAKRIQSEIGSVSLMRDFLELASQRLGVSLATPRGEDADPQLRELSSMYAYAVQLNRVLTGASSALRSEKLVINALATMSLSDIGKMSVDDRVALILGPPTDPSAVLSKFRNGSMFLTLGEQVGGGDCENLIDRSVSVYCGNAISNAINGENGSRRPQQADSLRNALDVCTEIANASRSTIRRPNRVVKDKTVLMNLVLGAAYGTSKASKLVDLSPSDCRHMVDSIWESYECLPTHLSPDEASQRHVQSEVDGLYENLVVVDIFSRWSPAALRVLVDLNATTNREGGRDRHVVVGLVVLTEICRSFCHQVGQVKGAVAPNAELDLLRDLMSDVDQLNNVGFNGTLPMVAALQENLVKPLLQREKFHLIDPLAKWINRNDVEEAVLAFVNEAMFNDDDSLSPIPGLSGSDRVQAAIGCQDILGPLFPDLRAQFESSRRYLDAASFINRMMADSHEFTYPNEVREKSPLDIIESVMTRNPGCVLEGCKDWTDPVFSRKANEAICGHYWSMQQGRNDDESPSRNATLPVLPGSAIYHLASLLGLQGPQSLLVVKSRVVCHAILLSEFAAAAAVCATMVYDNGSSWGEPAVAECIVDTVARVVSLNEYDDAQMKLALCSAVFQRDRGALSVLDCQAYETVLDSFVMLENATSRRQLPQDSPVDSPMKDAMSGRVLEETPTLNDFLVFRAVGLVAKTAKNVARHAHHPVDQPIPGVGPPPLLSDRVYQDILAQYSTDTRHLFWILRGVSASSKVDDPLLLTLGRLIGFWCIADALRMRPQSVPLEPERADLEDTLALGMSLLLHTQDREALVSCIGELQGILARETVATMERAASVVQADSVSPDPEIVRALISRGYSENGARRAAVMTGNESAQVALVWAVSHTLDEGFDDPIVSVASPNGSSDSGRVDQNMVHCLQETLNLGNDYISRKRSLQSLLPATKSLTKLLKDSQGGFGNGHADGNQKLAVTTSLRTKPVVGQEDKRSSDQIRKVGATNGVDKSEKRSSAMAIDMSVSSKPPAPAKPLAVPKQNERSAGSTPVKPKLAAKPTVPAQRAKAPPAAATSPATVRQPAPPPKPKAPLPAKTLPSTTNKLVAGAPSTKPERPKPAVPPPNRAARSATTPATASKVTAPSVDRLSTLRSHDKSTGTNLASDERQRLIAEGRRMLREARASKASSTAPNASSTTQTSDTSAAASSRYPIRSRTTAPSGATSSSASAAQPTRGSTVAQATKPAENAKEDDEDDGGWDFDDF